MKPQNLPEFILENLPWNRSSLALWPATCFTLRRNLSGKPFTERLSKHQQDQNLALLEKSLAELDIFKNQQLIHLDTLSTQEQHYLFEHFFLTDECSQTSKPQALMVSADCKHVAAINSDDHLILQCIDTGGDWHNSFDKLYQIEQQLSKNLSFAMHPKFGFLTSHFNQIGSGFTVKAYLHLPLCIRLYGDQLADQYFKEESSECLRISQVESHPFEENRGGFSDLIILQNHLYLGISEREVSGLLFTAALKLINEEKALRSQLTEEKSTYLKDQIARSFGVLKHSYQMQPGEALKALSDLKLGLDLGWIEGIKDQDINHIFFLSRRAHLQTLENKELSKEELLHLRSTFLTEKLKNAKLCL